MAAASLGMWLMVYTVTGPDWLLLWPRLWAC